MKASELIHNGLYLIHDASDTIVRYDITSNSFRSEWYEYPLALFHEDVCATEGDRYMFVKPIPLTPEILKKNGFHVMRKTEYASRWEMHDTCDQWSVECTTREHPIGEVFLRIYIDCNPIVQMWVTDVHILQDALRLCGLNELADNFKV